MSHAIAEAWNPTPQQHHHQQQQFPQQQQHHQFQYQQQQPHDLYSYHEQQNTSPTLLDLIVEHQRNIISLVGEKMKLFQFLTTCQRSIRVSFRTKLWT